MPTDEELSKSNDTSFSEQNESLHTLTDVDLANEIDALGIESDLMEKEIRIFENFLKRLEDDEFVKTKLTKNAGVDSSQTTINTASSTDKYPFHKRNDSNVTDDGGESIGPLLNTVQQRGSKRKSRSRSYSSNERTHKLTFEQKYEIAQKEVNFDKVKLKKITAEADERIDYIKASIEELEIRIIDNYKIQFEFNREVGRMMKPPEVGKKFKPISSSKIIKFITDKTRKEESTIEKLRLKHVALKIQKNKASNNLLQKEALGESLHEVDFSQLKIENKQYMTKMEELNQELLRLKLMAGNTHAILNSHRKKLDKLLIQARQLDTEIRTRKDLICRIDEENITVNKELTKADKINKNLKNKLSLYQVPQVTEYVTLNSKIYQINKEMKIWSRKVAIAKMAYHSLMKKYKHLKFKFNKIQ